MAAWDPTTTSFTRWTVVLVVAVLAHPACTEPGTDSPQDSETGGDSGASTGGLASDQEPPVEMERLEPEDCPEVGQFQCRAYSEGLTSASVDPTAVPFDADCWCNPDAPQTVEDCEKPEDFWCAHYQETLSCYCRPGSPASKADCAEPERFRCQFHEPLQGCDCTGLLADECDCPHCEVRCGPDEAPGCYCRNVGR